jgi:dTDP-4-dehydrorhamnose reductase
MMPKILVTGKNGQVGFELQRALAPLGDIIAIDRSECDLTDLDALRAFVAQVQPDVIVNPAAYTAVDKAESDADVAYVINRDAVRVMGEEAARLSALVIHFSTDYVFDGAKDGSYREDDATDPQSVYGASKLAGELALAEANPRHLILRTSWVVGAHGGNFAKTMLRLAGERERLSVVGDQHGAPTSAALLADVTAHLVRDYLHVQGEMAFGTYHVTGGGETTWYDYARFVLSEAIAAGKPLKAGPDAVAPLATKDYPTPAQRPANSRLDTSLFQATFGLHLPDWHQSVRHVLQQIF